MGAYLTVQYYKDIRFNPPSTYDYSISEDIDRDFYDPTVLEYYYETALEVGTYARSLWFNEEIDVRLLDKTDHESFEAVQHYNQLLVTTKRLEDLLVYSKSLKDKGYGNLEIEQIIENDLTPKQLEMRESQHLIGLRIGNTGAEVWELQKRLNQKGDSIPVDGIFSSITRSRVRAIQQANDLYPSGKIDEKTLRILLKD